MDTKLLEERLKSHRYRIESAKTKSEKIIKWMDNEGEYTKVPLDMQLSDEDMLALEKNIEQTACGILGLSSLDDGIWRPFWNAAYKDWGREHGPLTFWRHVFLQLNNTLEFLSYLESRI
ncbi:MAG TPA: hypothetical protein VF721_03740 [Pyrinomonadaceae bacterium]|jgi:hypothetical protein